ncbi:3445_t:CDS:2, partial [Cetraspora pellucida]
MTENFKEKKHQVEISSDSDNGNTNEPVGRQFTGIWKEIELVEELKEKKIKSTKLSEPCNIEINELLIAAFVSCGLPFNIIENSFVVHLLKVLCPEYNPPSCEVLAGRLLDTQVARVNMKIEQMI